MAVDDSLTFSGPLAPRRLSRLVLHRRDSIGTAYHVLTFEAQHPDPHPPGSRPEPSSPVVPARPGQFAMVRSAAWGQAPLLPRPMSLLTAGDRPSILIKVVGEGTRRLAHASSGEPFDLLAPLGLPWRPCPEHHRPVLVAGGVGVAPLLFLARELAARHRPLPAAPPSALSPSAVPSSALSPSAVPSSALSPSAVPSSALSPSAVPSIAVPPSAPAPSALPLALYGARTAGDLPLDFELAAVAELRVATEDGSRGTRGRVTVLLDHALDELAAAGRAAKVYTCGPDAMMAAVAALCAARGVLCDVSLETPMACGYGVCLGCPVPRAASKGFLYACTEGPCVDAASIDWSRSAGARR